MATFITIGYGDAAGYDLVSDESDEQRTRATSNCWRPAR